MYKYNNWSGTASIYRYPPRALLNIPNADPDAQSGPGYHYLISKLMVYHGAGNSSEIKKKRLHKAETPNWVSRIRIELLCCFAGLTPQY
jgi:hypothetical protein